MEHRREATGPDGIRLLKPIIPAWSEPRDMKYGFFSFAAILLRFIVIISLRTFCRQTQCLPELLNARPKIRSIIGLFGHDGPSDPRHFIGQSHNGDAGRLAAI